MSENPEIKNGSPPPSKIIGDLIDPTPVLSPDLTSHERRLLERAVLGKNSHAESLFRRFAYSIKLAARPRQINTLKITVLPTTMTPVEIQIAKQEESGVLVFNDYFVGHDLEIRHTQEHGVFSLTLIDKAESPANSNSSLKDTGPYPEIELIDYNMEGNSMVSILLTDDGRLFIMAIINGELIRTRIKDKAELGFSEICNALLWSPAI